MSAFLGPIHFWVYHKIQVQQHIIEEIQQMETAKNLTLEEVLDKKCGRFESGDLEDIIDKGNIHGWLQERVSQVEHKLAFAVTTLVNTNAKSLNQLMDIFYLEGEKLAIADDADDAKVIYKIISDNLLDGMPCDHANTLLEETADKVVWQRNSCVHSQYWEAVGGDVNIYYLLREAFMKGCLSNTTFAYEKVDETKSQIVRGGINV